MNDNQLVSQLWWWNLKSNHWLKFYLMIVCIHFQCARTQTMTSKKTKRWMHTHKKFAIFFLIMMIMRYQKLINFLEIVYLNFKIKRFHRFSHFVRMKRDTLRNCDEKWHMSWEITHFLFCIQRVLFLRFDFFDQSQISKV